LSFYFNPIGRRPARIWAIIAASKPAPSALIAVLAHRRRHPWLHLGPAPRRRQSGFDAAMIAQMRAAGAIG